MEILSKSDGNRMEIRSLFGACVSDDSRPPCLTARPLNPAFTGCYPICGCDPQQEKHHGLLGNDVCRGQKPKGGFCHLESDSVCLVDAFGPR